MARTTPPVGLARVLSLADLSVLSSASMAPSYSIAATFGLMVAAAGGAALLALVVLTIAVACIAVAFYRLCEEQPIAGSTYSWSRAAFGEKAGAFAAWIVLFSYFAAAAAAVVPAGIYTLDLFAPGLSDNAWAVAIAGSLWVIVASALLIGGVRPTAQASALFLFVEIAILVVFAANAFAHAPVSQPTPVAFLSLGPGGAAGFLGAMVIAIWVTDGWEISTYASEENKSGSRHPGAGALIALFATSAIILLCMIAFMRVGTLQGFSEHAGNALTYVAQQLGGGWRIPLMILTVLVSTAATLWTTQLGLSRGLFAMARDRLFPAALALVHPRFRTPAASIALVNSVVLAVVLLTGFFPTAKAALDDVINATSIIIGLTFILTGMACVRHFRSRGTPVLDLTRIVLPSVGTLAIVVLLVVNFANQSRTDQLIALGCVAFSIAFAFWPGRRSMA